MPFLNTLAVNQCSQRLRDSILITFITSLSKYELLQPHVTSMNIPTATETNTRASCALRELI